MLDHVDVPPSSSAIVARILQRTYASALKQGKVLPPEVTHVWMAFEAAATEHQTLTITTQHDTDASKHDFPGDREGDSEDSATYSLSAAAETAQVTYRTAQRWVETGHLTAHKCGGRWRVDHTDLMDFIYDRRSR